ncbi:MAG: S-methyl-5-thioribose-1-phosphate isomerase [Myxococcota bacterium]|nr:S-methyl-5-thioribose-1-phosphate isomerase [Myxococcota bacterium]
MSLESIRWTGESLQLLDQRMLPAAERWLTLRSSAAVAAAITDMVVRGAPAIAITAAYGLALAVAAGEDRAAAAARLLAARPTAVNLRWAIERLAAIPDDAVAAEAVEIHREDRDINRRLGDAGAGLLSGGVLTICNTGALATGGWGTALGIVRSAIAAGRRVHVYALETRPYLQGARLTAYECVADGIPATLLTDSMAGALLATGRVSAAVVGCDRVAANGDTANKIGTYSLAVLCRHHGVPLYVAMPTSTLDLRCPTGAEIPIEQRPAEEVRGFGSSQTAPSLIDTWNPAFDVTPADLIAGWVTEHGMWQPSASVG